MAVSIPGLIAMVLFYLLVLGIGVWASIKSKREERKSAADQTDMAVLGNRSIKKVVGIFTMTGEASQQVVQVALKQDLLFRIRSL